MSDAYGTTTVRKVAARPLTKGMFSNISSLGLPDGSFYNVRGYDIRENGPRRCDPFQLLINQAIPYWDANEVADNIESFTGNNNRQITVVITDRSLYKVEFAQSGNAFTPVYWKRAYTVGTYTAGTGVTTVVTHNPQTDLVAVGDFARLATDTGTTLHPITAVGATSITIEPNLAVPPVADATLYIVKKFKVARPFIVDYTVFSRSDISGMVLVDGSVGGLYYYNGSYLSDFTLHDQNDAATYTSARTVNHFNGIIYFGMVGKSGGFFPNRLIWTTILDMQEVNSLAYQDLTGSPGQVLKLSSLGSMIFCFFTDAIYFGRPTNLAGLPYAFTMMDTGGISAVGMRSITPFLDGQVFVSRDDIYYVTAANGLEPIGSPVMRETILHANEVSRTRTQVCLDSPRTRLFFGFSKDQDYFDTAAMFNYRTKAWSLLDLSASTAFNVVAFIDELEFDDVPAGDEFDDAPWVNRVYATLNASVMLGQFAVINTDRYIHIISDGGQTNVYSGVNLPVRCVIESGDFDFDAPDVDKSVLQLGLKINSLVENPRTLPLSFLVEVSNDRGYGLWKNAGTLTVPSSKSEGSVAFRITGSTFRFRLTSLSVVEAYEINEYTLKIGIRGEEPSRFSTSSNP